MDLRVDEVSQDDIFKDEERMTEMQNLVDKLQDGYRDKSIIEDLKLKGASNVFSKLKEMGNIELYQLSETVRTTKCPLCLKHSKEGQPNADAESAWYTLKNTKITFRKESTSLQNLCT